MSTLQSNALVIGSNGEIGSALVAELAKSHRVATLSRDNTDYSVDSLMQWKQTFRECGEFECIVCCIGVLHDDVVSPEKRIQQIETKKLEHYFHVNAILPMLCLQAFLPLLSRKNASTFACLSAMVGSIEDNQLGGWYGYRSSKAALNMLVKTTAIELARTKRNASVVAIHPGTTQSALSAPFAQNLTNDKYYTPAQSAERIVSVMHSVSSTDSGAFLNWDGQRLPW